MTQHKYTLSVFEIYIGYMYLRSAFLYSNQVVSSSRFQWLSGLSDLGVFGTEKDLRFQHNDGLGFGYSTARVAASLMPDHRVESIDDFLQYKFLDFPFDRLQFRECVFAFPWSFPLEVDLIHEVAHLFALSYLLGTCVPESFQNRQLIPRLKDPTHHANSQMDRG